MKTQLLGRQEWMVQTDCFHCGMIFMIPQWLETQCREIKRVWYCPGCGKQTVYTQSEVDRLKKDIEDAARQATFWQHQYDHEQQRHERTEHRRRATAGHLTRIKKRAAAGVCPCCRRTVKQLAAHMATKHPEFVTEQRAAKPEA